METQHQSTREVQVQSMEIQLEHRSFEELYHYVLHKVWFNEFSRDDLVGYLVCMKVQHERELKEAKNENNQC